MSLRSRHLVAALLGPGFLLGAATRALSNENAKILLHLQPPATREACARPGSAPPCGDLVVSGDLVPDRYFAYVLVTDALACDGISAVQFGIDYDRWSGQGVDVLDWASCADQVIATDDWPAAGSGLRLSWNAATRCQRSEPGGAGSGVVAVAGYFYVAAYSLGRLAITPHPADGRALVVDCSARSTLLEGRGRPPTPSPLGYASFSPGGVADPGYGPCGAVIHPPACTVTGTTPVIAGSTHAYTMDTNDCPVSIAWSVSGPGEIVGSATDPVVWVRARSGGFIIVGADFITARGSGTCALTVEVTEPPPPPPLECLIRGPSRVLPGSTTWFDASYQSGTTYTWSITGSGALAGPTAGSGASVLAGSPGSFTVHLRLTRGTESDSCRKVVAVEYEQGSCTILGPDRAFEGPATCFFDGGEQADATWAWNLVGNGTIVGSSTGRFVQVVPGRYWFGTFWLELTVQTAAATLHCLKMITVVPAPDPAPAGRNEGARVALHLAGRATERPCFSAAALPRCSDLVTRGVLYPAGTCFAIVLVTDAVTDGSSSSGVGGVSFGIEYDGVPGVGVDIFGFTPCGLLEVPTAGWPQPGSGNLILWDGTDRCQRTEPEGTGTGVMARAGYFYLAAYTPDELRITTHPEAGTVTLFDCLGAGSVVATVGRPKEPWPLGRAAFSADGLSPGYNPCSRATPVERTTWGRIKALYRN